MNSRSTVVGAAIVRRGTVLAARRTTPPEVAGRWEFPGGKVEPGESPEVALVREIGEELGCRVEVTGWLAGATPIGDHHELKVATCVITRGEPDPVEHDLTRWLTSEQLDEVDWLEPDLPFLAELRRRMDVAVRGIFFEEDHARAAARRLRADGYPAEVVRERLSGEDDDEGHPWAVVTDAPVVALELLVERYDGWLDAGAPTPPLAPLHLPSAPKRHHRDP